MTVDPRNTEVHELEIVDISEGSLVDAGANPEAHIMLFKAKDTIGTKIKKMFGMSMDDILADQAMEKEFFEVRNAFLTSVENILMAAPVEDVGALMKETSSQFSAAMGKLFDQTENTEKVKELKKIMEDLDCEDIGSEQFDKAMEGLKSIELPAICQKQEKEVEMSNKTFEDMVSAFSEDELAVLKAGFVEAVQKQEDKVEEPEVPAEIQKRLDEAEQKVEQAEQEAEELRKQAQKAAYMQKAKEIDAPGVSPDELSEILQKAADAGFEDDLVNMVKGLATVSDKIEELTKVTGSGDSNDAVLSRDEAWDAVQSQAADLVEKTRKDPKLKTLTHVEAEFEVKSKNPDLWANARGLKQ